MAVVVLQDELLLKDFDVRVGWHLFGLVNDGQILFVMNNDAVRVGAVVETVDQLVVELVPMLGILVAGFS